MNTRRAFYTAVCCILTLLTIINASAVVGDWPVYRHDLSQSGYSDVTSEFNLNYTGTLWNFKTEGWIHSPPTVGDLNNDGLLEIAVGSDDGNIYVLNSNGSLSWNYSTQGKVRAPIAIGDLDKQGNKEIVAGSEEGRVYALTSDGRVLWTYKTKDSVKFQANIVELYENHYGKEVVVTEGNKIHILDSSGVEIANYRLFEDFRYQPVISDVNGDGSMEISFASTDNTIYILNKFLTVTKQFSVKGKFISTPTSVDMDGNKIEDITFATLDEGVYTIYHTTYTGVNSCYTSSCLMESAGYIRLYPVWTSEYDKIMTQLTFTDLNDDGRLEAVLLPGSNTIHIFDINRIQALTYTVNGAIDSMPAIADLDGDSKPEVIFGADDGNIYALNYPNGSRIIAHLDNAVRSSPAIADLTNDGKAEILVGCDDNSIYALGDTFQLQSEKAAKALKEAEAAKARGDVKNASEQASNALDVYIKLKDDKGASTASNLMGATETSRSAAVYYENALLTYKSYNLEDTSKLIEEAIKEYSTVNDVDGLIKATDLKNKVEAHVKANDNYKKGLNSYNANGVNQEAKELVELAKAGYTAVSYSPGVVKCDSVLKRMTADELMKDAEDEYSLGNFDKSKEYADQAFAIYSQLNFDRGMNKSVSIIGLSIKSISEKAGEKLFSNAIKLIAGLITLALLALVYKHAKRTGIFSRITSLTGKFRKPKQEVQKTWLATEHPVKENAIVRENAVKKEKAERLEYIKEAANVDRRYKGGDSNDLLLLMIQLRKLGLMDSLSMNDAKELMSTSDSTLNRWIERLTSKGWIRAIEINGEKHIELTDTSGKKTKEEQTKEESTNKKEEPVKKEVKTEINKTATYDDEFVVVPKHVHERLVSAEEKLQSMEEKKKGKQELDNRHKQLMSMLSTVESATPVELAIKLGRTSNSVGNDLLDLMNQGLLERIKEGKSFRYSLKKECT